MIKCIDLDAYRDDFYAKVLDILSADFSNDRANQIIDEFDSLPTIEAEPIKYGKWLKTNAYPHRVYCSECYKTYVTNEEVIQGRSWETAYCTEAEFCPHCGAKMNGGKENEST